MMSALVRRRFPLFQHTGIGLNLRRLHTPASKDFTVAGKPHLARLGELFSQNGGSGLRSGASKQSTYRRLQTNGIVSLGTPSLLFHDRRAPRPEQISRTGPIALQASIRSHSQLLSYDVKLKKHRSRQRSFTPLVPTKDCLSYGSQRFSRFVAPPMHLLLTTHCYTSVLGRSRNCSDGRTNYYVSTSCHISQAQVYVQVSA